MEWTGLIVSLVLREDPQFCHESQCITREQYVLGRGSAFPKEGQLSKLSTLLRQLLDSSAEKSCTLTGLTISVTPYTDVKLCAGSDTGLRENSPRAGSPARKSSCQAGNSSSSNFVKSKTTSS